MKWRNGKRKGLARPTPETERDHAVLLGLLHAAGCPDADLQGALTAMTGGQEDRAMAIKVLEEVGWPVKYTHAEREARAERAFNAIPAISEAEYERAKARWEREYGEGAAARGEVEAPQWLVDLHQHPVPERPRPVIPEGVEVSTLAELIGLTGDPGE